MGTCPTNTDGSLTPFVAKYCTAFGYDMDMMRTMSGQELICAMSEKLNEAVCFDNKTREMQEQLETATEEWENQLEQEYVTNLQEKVDVSIDNLFEEGKLDVVQNTVLCFGDSFGVHDDGMLKWPDLISSKLGYNLKNYCVGGDSFPFSNQVAAAKADFPNETDRNKIAFGIVYGGINQTVNNPLDSDATIISFITNFNTNFPGVKLYVAPFNNCSPYNTNYPNCFTNTIISYRKITPQLKYESGNFIILPNAPFYNTAPTLAQLWQSDMLHPTQLGQYYIASNMVNAINGDASCFNTHGQYGDIPQGVTIGSEGYRTADGFFLPQIKVNSGSSGTVYFISGGYWIDSQAIGYDSNGDIMRFNIQQDTSNQQFYITLVSHNTNYVIPPQMIPWTTKPEVQS